MSVYRELWGMAHHGEILGKALNATGFKKNLLADLLGVHPNTVTNYLSRAVLPIDLWRKIAKYVEYDFVTEAPALKEVFSQFPSPFGAFPGDQFASYQLPVLGEVPNTLPACQAELIQLQRAMIVLQQQHIEMLKRYSKQVA
ncbi:helix-turn-helix domain-containing protein [Hymenobacter puniceus]|uniref:helix-turn-helix domain-containing protein n=1 Tax=Hymenobacter sp. BT190 TaxID=2763505 RepID=UPI001650DFA1|nr:helix-turn-helix transcriptional regulator [Hymenobacter sp. BT190]MBC6698058.1 helix-turn-helix transcriptional regulator [Hymenobacter sp. BT190]